MEGARALSLLWTETEQPPAGGQRTFHLVASCGVAVASAAAAVCGMLARHSSIPDIFFPAVKRTWWRGVRARWVHATLLAKNCL